MMDKGKLLGENTSYEADGAVTQFRGGQITATGVKQCDASGQRCDGVIAWDAADGEQVTLMTGGVQTAISGAAVAAAAEVMVDDDGKFITHVAGAGNEVAGIAETPTTGADQTFKLSHFKGNPTR
jgi:hypothetical protein